MDKEKWLESPATRGFKKSAGFIWNIGWSVSKWLFKPAFWELSRPTGMVSEKSINNWQWGRTMALVYLGMFSMVSSDNFSRGFTLDTAHVLVATALGFGAGSVVDWIGMGLVRLGRDK